MGTATQTYERWIALAALVAALAFAIGPVAGQVVLTRWDPGQPVLIGAAVVGGAAPVVVAVSVWRRGDRTSLGFALAVGAFVWLSGGLAIWLGTLPGTSQTVLTVLFAIPAVGQFAAFVAAALLFAGPLLRPVCAGGRYLWSTADVR